MTEGEQENDKQHGELATFIGSTTLHGIRYSCDDSPLARRVFWVVVVVCSVAFCAFQISMSLMTYYEFNTVTSTTTSSANDELRFPTLTLCNNNRVHRARMFATFPEIARAWQHVEFVRAGAASPNNNTNTSVLYDVNILRVAIATYIHRRETFLDCRFAGVSLDCNDCVTTTATSRGHCFSFNSQETIERNGSLISRGAGPAHGAEFILDALPDQYFIPSDTGVGFSLYVHHPDVRFDPDEPGIKLAPGSAFDVTITEEQYSILSTPYNKHDCVGPEYKMEEQSDNSSYSQPLCNVLCAEETRHHVCNCTVVPDEEDEEICSVGQFFDCQETFKPCYCPPLCHSSEYDPHVSFSRYPNNLDMSTAEYLGLEELEIRAMRRRYVALRVYFRSMRVTSIKQSPAMQAWDIFSNVGGLFGLFMGASILTLLEFCDFAVFIARKTLSESLKKWNKPSKYDVRS